jgi:NAD(P)H dehydrogenase (quinone)
MPKQFVTMMTSSAGQHGGQETTYLTTFPFFAHQGLVYVPIGYQNAGISDNSVVQGGSPYGASTIAGGDGARQPTAAEQSVAEFQGKVGFRWFLKTLSTDTAQYFSEFVAKFVRGSQ